MKKQHLFIILIALATFVLGCGEKPEENIKYNCKITGQVRITIDGNSNYFVPNIDVTLTPKNSKMQYFETVKTDDKGMFQFNEAYKGIEYKLTCEGNITDIGPRYGETEYFTVSKDEWIQKDIYLEPK
jgi:hypothetical protein